MRCGRHQKFTRCVCITATLLSPHSSFTRAKLRKIYPATKQSRSASLAENEIWLMAYLSLSNGQRLWCRFFRQRCDLLKILLIFACTFFVHIEQISKDAMRTFVLYLFAILWAVTGLSNSGQDICGEGAADYTVAPASCVTSSFTAPHHTYDAPSFEAASNLISTYATKNNNSAKEDAKHKTQNKSALLGQKFSKLNSIHSSDTLSHNLLSPESALFVLAFICRLNI